MCHGSPFVVALDHKNHTGANRVGFEYKFSPIRALENYDGLKSNHPPIEQRKGASQ